MELRINKIKKGRITSSDVSICEQLHHLLKGKILNCTFMKYQYLHSSFVNFEACKLISVYRFYTY